MSFQPGQIIGTDLSANANILGTQIADKTLQFRNFNEDVFKIVKSGTIQSAAVSISNPGAGKYSSDTQTVAVGHSLGYIPAIIAYILDSNSLGVQLPYYFNHGTSSGITSASWATIFASASATSLFISTDVLVFATAWAFNNVTFPIRYYLLQESAI